MQQKQFRLESKVRLTNSLPSIIFDLKLKTLSRILRVIVRESEKRGYTFEELLQGFSQIAHERGLSRTSFFLDEASYESARVRKKQKRK